MLKSYSSVSLYMTYHHSSTILFDSDFSENRFTKYFCRGGGGKIKPNRETGTDFGDSEEDR